ncbi:MAG: N-acetylmuramoyl-L-alanine amidase-like domain-containing protein [Pseudomonadota bacterium]
MRRSSLLFVIVLLCAAARAALAVDTLLATPIYQMTPQDVNRYLPLMQQSQPALRQRVAAIARQNIGQPYMLNLLGEYPYQLHDKLPMFSLEKSDCVVFAEHTYAMALSRSWDEFFWMLQRIRYKDGVIGVATRNHYTEVDWNINNSWLVTDITAALAGPGGPSYALTVDRAQFLKARHNTERAIAVQESREAYIPKDQLAQVLPRMQDGDLVNVVSRRDGKTAVSHVGLIVVGPDGQRNFLNSADPMVREESFDAFFARTAEREQRQAREGKNGLKLLGFKLLRLNDNIIVPPAAPQPRP